MAFGQARLDLASVIDQTIMCANIGQNRNPVCDMFLKLVITIARTMALRIGHANLFVSRKR